MTNPASNVFQDPVTWWDQQTHPVYNRLGRNIGFFRSDQLLAQGIIELYDGEAHTPANELYVKDLLSVLIPASTYVIGKGLQPVWMTPAAALAASPMAQQSTPAFDLPNFGVPSLPALPNAAVLQQYAIVGGLALLAVLIVRRIA